MKRHIKEALTKTGLLNKVSVGHGARGGHYAITLPNGKTVRAASSPKNEHTAALEIVRDIRRAMAHTGSFSTRTWS